MNDEMGMDYVPIYAEPTAVHEKVAVTGLVGVTIDTQRQQMIGMGTALVTLGPVGREWRTTGRVCPMTRPARFSAAVSALISVAMSPARASASPWYAKSSASITAASRSGARHSAVPKCNCVCR